MTDSQVVRSWVRSGKPKARPDLEEKATLAKELVARKNLRVEWRPREQNKAGIWNESCDRGCSHFRSLIIVLKAVLGLLKILASISATISAQLDSS